MHDKDIELVNQHLSCVAKPVTLSCGYQGLADTGRMSAFPAIFAYVDRIVLEGRVEVSGLADLISCMPNLTSIEDERANLCEEDIVQLIADSSIFEAKKTEG